MKNVLAKQTAEAVKRANAEQIHGESGKGKQAHAGKTPAADKKKRDAILGQGRPAVGSWQVQAMHNVSVYSAMTTQSACMWPQAWYMPAKKAMCTISGSLTSKLARVSPNVLRQSEHLTASIHCKDSPKLLVAAALYIPVLPKPASPPAAITLRPELCCRKPGLEAYFEKCVCLILCICMGVSTHMLPVK
eukprot:scaffold53038_cov17-Tisochrysis_lutea.AAC.1